MNKRRLLIIFAGAMLLSGLVSPRAEAQSARVVRAEYFINADPGFGHGTPISLSPDTAAVASFHVATAGLSPGFHTLYVRAQDDKGIWGMAEARNFYLAPPAAEPSPTPVATAEYFIGADPGFGHGTPISLSPDTAAVASFHVATAGLSPGFHTLYVRSRDDKGIWGMAEARNFYLAPPAAEPSPPPIVAVEYFIGADPGFGHGAPISLASDTAAVASFHVATSGLNPGFHTLYVRSRDDKGIWGMAEARNFYLAPPAAEPSPPPIVAVEYFIGADPGFGHGTPISLASSDTASFEGALATSLLDLGNYTFTVRAKDANGIWGMRETRSFSVTVAGSPDDNAPVLAPIGDLTVAVFDTLRVTLSVVSSDGDSLKFYVYNNPSGSELVDNIFIWVPTEDQAGPHEVTFAVDDGRDRIGSETVTLTVILAPPVAHPGDFNGDLQVGFSDFLIFAGAFGSRVGDPAYREIVDLNKDGVVDFSDFLTFAALFGTQYSASKKILAP